MAADASPPTLHLSSSLRTRSAEESLPLAREIALSRGVSRVVDTTWLDRIGIPVYASVRPDAHRQSLAVHAGKGRTHAEARIGAYMEAIEFSFAEPGRSVLRHRMARPADVITSFRDQVRFVDFCPRTDCRVGPDDALAVIEADEIAAGLGPVLVPAELVYHPFAGTPGVQLYGTTTNGLASGNSVDEATVHGLAEVMERHVHSFQMRGAPSRLVDPASLPPALAEMAGRIEAAGLRCVLRYVPNEFALPMFVAYALEPVDDRYVPLAIAAGSGFHANADIAAVRALAESVQSRLTTIHGGRDDLIDKHVLADSVGAEPALRHLRRLKARVLDDAEPIAFADIPEARVATIAEAHAALVGALRASGMRHVARAVYTEPGYPFQVVRIIVPGAEYHEHDVPRVGPRLLAWVNERRLRAAEAVAANGDAA